MAMFSLANAAGAAFRAALNTVLGKLHGNYYGSTDPSGAGESTPGMLWVDTSGGTPVLKARNAADTGWITLGALDPAAFQLAGTSAFGRSLIDDADSTAAHGTLGLGSLATKESITTADIAAATLVTSTETIAANNNNTTIPTSAAVKAYVDGAGVNVDTAIAGLSAGAVGTYAFLRRINITEDTDHAFGATVSGSSLQPFGLYVDEAQPDIPKPAFSGAALSGTWRCMGYGQNEEKGAKDEWSATLWLRIS